MKYTVGVQLFVQVRPKKSTISLVRCSSVAGVDIVFTGSAEQSSLSLTRSINVKTALENP